MTTCSSSPETATWLLLVWSVTGPRAVESSTMPPRPSSCGSTRRTSPASSPWRREEMSRVFSPVWPAASRLSEMPSRPRLARTTPAPSSTDTSSCPTNLGTGMRASVHVDLPGWTAESVDKLKARCEELAVQPRGTKGESGGQTGHTYDISNKHRLGYSEVQP